MTTLDLFKSAGILEDLKASMDNDYVKYPLMGAGVGGLASGAASAFGGGEKNETSQEARKRILNSVLQGGAFGGLAGLGTAAGKSLFSGALSSHDHAKGEEEPKNNLWRNIASGIGGATGAVTGHVTAGKYMDDLDAGIAKYNETGNKIVSQIEEAMKPSAAEAAAIKNTGNAFVPPSNIDELLSRISSTTPEHAATAAGQAAKAISHTGNPVASGDISNALNRMLGSASPDATGPKGISGALKKLLTGLPGGGEASALRHAEDVAKNGFRAAEAIGPLKRVGGRLAGGVGGAIVGAGLPAFAGWATTSSSDIPYAPPRSAKTSD